MHYMSDMNLDLSETKGCTSIGQILKAISEDNLMLKIVVLYDAVENTREFG